MVSLKKHPGCPQGCGNCPLSLNPENAYKSLSLADFWKYIFDTSVDWVLRFSVSIPRACVLATKPAVCDPTELTGCNRWTLAGISFSVKML